MLEKKNKYLGKKFDKNILRSRIRTLKKAGRKKRR
jgi:hypothetical protein